VRRILHLNEHIASLDAPLEIDPAHSLGEAIADESAVDPETLLQLHEKGELLDDWLAELAPRQRRIIEARYGLSGADAMTLEALASELGLTRERVRQIQAEALDRLRTIIKRRGVDRDSLL
jgi:RNA polymerase nonessential primary-like sigma factor